MREFTDFIKKWEVYLSVIIGSIFSGTLTRIEMPFFISNLNLTVWDYFVIVFTFLWVIIVLYRKFIKDAAAKRKAEKEREAAERKAAAEHAEAERKAAAEHVQLIHRWNSYKIELLDVKLSRLIELLANNNTILAKEITKEEEAFIKKVSQRENISEASAKNKLYS